MYEVQKQKNIVRRGGILMDTMEQRRNTIVDLVNQSGNVSFAQLKKKFPQISERGKVGGCRGRDG